MLQLRTAHTFISPGAGALRWLAILTVALVSITSGAAGQDDPPATDDTMADLLQQWQDLDRQLTAAEQALAEKPDDAALKNAYREQVTAATDLVDRLTAAAQAQLQADRTSADAIRVLLGIMLDAAKRDQDARVLELGDILISQGVNPGYFEWAAKSDQLAIHQKEIFDELLIRHAEAMANDLPRAKLVTNKGTIVVELFENEAPGTVGNFIQLAERGYFDGVLFHRVMEDFMAQTGGIRLNEKGEEVGEEGPGYNIVDECQTPVRRLHFTGSLSMANRGIPNTGGSQFFVTFERTDFLDDRHTVFGRVISGQEVLDQLTRTNKTDAAGQEVAIEGVVKDQLKRVEIIRKRDHPYAPVKVQSETTEDTPADLDSSLELNAPDESDGG